LSRPYFYFYYGVVYIYLVAADSPQLIGTALSLLPQLPDLIRPPLLPF
jgi:hypothetical protein